MKEASKRRQQQSRIPSKGRRGYELEEYEDEEDEEVDQEEEKVNTFQRNRLSTEERKAE